MRLVVDPTSPTGVKIADQIANVSISGTSFDGKTTDDLPEGSTNLYSQWSADSPGIKYAGHISVGADAAVDATGPFLSSLQGLLGEGTTNDIVSIYENMSGTPSTFNNALAIKLDANFTGATAVYGGIENTVETNSASTGDFTIMYGVYNTIRHRGSGNIGAGIYANPAIAYHAGTGTVQNAYGNYGAVENTSNGTITAAYAVYAASLQNGSGGTVTQNYGLYISQQTAGSTNYNIYSQGLVDNYFDGYVRTSSSGGFYMNAPGSVNNRFVINTPTTADAAAECLISPSSGARHPLVLQAHASQIVNVFEVQTSAGALSVGINSSQQIIFGAGGDVNLYRSTTDTLKTDDAFETASTITLANTQYLRWRDSSNTIRNIMNYTGSNQLNIASDATGGNDIVFKPRNSTFLTLDQSDNAAALETGISLKFGGAEGDTNLYRSASNTLTTDDSFEVGGSLKIGSNWLFQTATEDSVERLTLKAVGANDAAELFLHPTGSASTSRLTITDAVNTTNYAGIAVESTTTENTIESIKAGTGTAQPIKIKMDGTDVVTVATNQAVTLSSDFQAGDVFSTDEDAGASPYYYNRLIGGLAGGTITSAYGTAKSILGVSGTYNIAGTNSVAPVGYNFEPTWVFTTNGFGFGSGFLFWNHMKVQNDSGTTRTVGGLGGYVSQTNYQANGGSLTPAFSAEFLSQPTFDRINSGTTTIGNYSIGFWSNSATISTGATVPAFYHFKADPATVTGTLTTQVGMAVSSMTTGTNNTHILIGTATTGDWGIYQSTSTANYLGGNLETAGQMTAATWSGLPKRTITVVFEDGGSALSTGAQKAYLSVPYSGTITKWRLLALDGNTGSITVDIWKDTYANFAPTDADSITASDQPTISASNKNEGTSLTGWTTSVTEGDILEFNIDSVSTFTKVKLELFVEATS